jgi:hypothetical protein
LLAEECFVTKLFNNGHVMGLQFTFFEQEEGRTSGNVPEGLHYRPELIGPSDEDALVARIRELAFHEFEFHGSTASRVLMNCVTQSPFATCSRNSL